VRAAPQVGTSAWSACGAGAFVSVVFFTGAPPPEIYTLSLHDALPIFVWPWIQRLRQAVPLLELFGIAALVGTVLLLRQMQEENRSEEHTSELQSRSDLVCRLLLEKKKKYDRSRAWSCTSTRAGAAPPP